MYIEESLLEFGKETCLEWSMAKAPKEGESECGDFHLVCTYRDKLLIAVVDGLGHGESAAQAGEKAIQTLQSFNNQSLISLVNQCHAALKNTRGVVLSIGLIDPWENTLTWIGIGNVEGTLLRADNRKSEFITLRGGVVGYKLPALHASMLTIDHGDIILFATDGVDKNYIDQLTKNATLQKIVNYTATNCFKRSDDALILAGRYIKLNT